MTGKVGRSGGARPGAGRPKKIKSAPGAAVQVAMEAQQHGGALKRAAATPVEIADRDMLQLLQDIALGRVNATATQVRAAVAAVQYTHTKKGDGGKKDEVAGKAKQAAAGRFGAAAPPPRLAAAGGKKV